MDVAARSSILGLKSTDCPKYGIEPCYEECAHINYVTDVNLQNNIYFLYSQEYIRSLIESMLGSQELFLREICEFDEICKIGEWLNFPCVQCDYVMSAGFSLCPSEIIECDGIEYQVIDPCIVSDICVANICDDICVLGEIDFSSSPQLIELYDRLLNAILTFSGTANWQGIETMAKLIFGETASVLSVRCGVYYVDAGRPLSEVETKSINIIKKLMPLPICAKVEFIKEV